MKFVAESHADYMNFVCSECGGEIEVQFLGYDPAVPRFRFTCRQCKQSYAFKMQFQLWKGLPAKATK